MNNIEYDYSAVLYYYESNEFLKKLYESGIFDLKASDAVLENENATEIFGNKNIFDPVWIEDTNSYFNQHRLKVIRYNIEKELSTAIANFNNYSGVSANFQMPKLKEDEWEKIFDNISIISFLQGLDIGGKVYNGYSIITNTKNKEVVTEDSIYITTTDGQYHNVKENNLYLYSEEQLENGYLNIDFERTSITDSSGVTKYFFPQKHLASYSSIVTQANVENVENLYSYLCNDNKNQQLAKIYYTALAREKYSSYKSTNNVDEIIKTMVQMHKKYP